MPIEVRRTSERMRREHALKLLVENPRLATRELCRRSMYHFLQTFWEVASAHKFLGNWHIEYLCKELEEVARQVGSHTPRTHDLIINVPPGSTKTITCSIMFPVWCWTQWPWMRFICASYSGQLSLESAETSRDLIRSALFQEIYPDIDIREDKDTKSNFKVVKRVTDARGKVQQTGGGYRYSTSVGGTLMGFHGDILIVDDPLNPTQAASEVELANANRWMEQTLPTRKTDKAVSTTILIMQRLNQADPTGSLLEKQKQNIRHICIPGEARLYRKQISPPELYDYYVDDLMDPRRLSWSVLADLEADLGQYGYAGQIGQDPSPPGGGMFKVDAIGVVDKLPPAGAIVKTVRYWDKAATEGAGAYTVGVRMSQLISGKWLVEDVKRGRWDTHERERIIRAVAEADGSNVTVWMEQEPGSGGKDSVQASILNLAGFAVYAERPTGDKAFRADPYSVQVNNGNVQMLRADWNREYVEELRYFPNGKYKDQVDASAAAFMKLVSKKVACRVT